VGALPSSLRRLPLTLSAAATPDCQTLEAKLAEWQAIVDRLFGEVETARTEEKKARAALKACPAGDASEPRLREELGVATKELTSAENQLANAKEERARVEKQLEALGACGLPGTNCCVRDFHFHRSCAPARAGRWSRRSCR
jgi:predicted  nucleic acid-binding Zn-ribbon protein